MSISVPAAGSQLKLNVRLLNGSPSGLCTSSPGHWKVVVQGDSASLFLIAGIWTIEKTAMMIAYGAYALMTSTVESCAVSSRRFTCASIAGSCTDAPAAAGRWKRPAGATSSASSGSAGDQIRRKPTMHAVEKSDATMSVSSTEMKFEQANCAIANAIAPNATGAVLATSASDAAFIGRKPRAISITALMATGVPKPASASIRAPKQKDRKS